MPKQRRTTIASREDDQDQELSRRRRNRLAALGPITVEIESRTRDTVEEVEVTFDANGASVISPGGEYHVGLDNDSCTCPDYSHRGGVCRHMRAADMAQEAAERQMMIGPVNDELPITEVSQEVNTNDVSDETSISRDFTEDNHFFLDNPENFSAELEAARATDIPYRYENVLNGSNITFGVELEFVGGNSNAIANELYRLGLCSSPSMEGYHTRSRTSGKWIVERDGSVTDAMGHGGEIISPILRDTPDTWRQIEKVCEVARRHGARVSQKTGAHVHVGASELLDGKKYRWKRFFKCCVAQEETYTRLSGGEQGVFRGGIYAASSIRQNRGGIRANLPSDESQDLYRRAIGNIAEAKYQRINLMPFAGKGTVEFRGFNGSLTPGIIQANVMYAAGVVNTAERSRKNSSESLGIFPSDSDKKRASLINDFESFKERGDKNIMYTLDTVFSRIEDKNHVLAVIARNSWFD